MLGQGSLCCTAVAGRVGAGNPNTPKSIPQCAGLLPALGPGGTLEHLPAWMGADGILSSTGRSQTMECKGGASHHAVAEVTARQEMQAEAETREEEIQVVGLRLQRGGDDSHPQRLG